MTGKSQADRLREVANRSKARKATTETTAATPPPAEPESPATAKPRRQTRQARPAVVPNAPLSKPVRSTVDLPPARHAAFKSWCAESAVELGRSRVTTQDVMRVLVGRLLTDEAFANRIRDDLRQAFDSQ